MRVLVEWRDVGPSSVLSVEFREGKVDEDGWLGTEDLTLDPLAAGVELAAASTDDVVGGKAVERGFSSVIFGMGG